MTRTCAKLRRKTGAILGASALLMSLNPLAVYATIQLAQSTVQPSTTIVAVGQASSVVLSWSVVSVIAAGPYTVTSTAGQFLAGATVLGTVNSTLSGGGNSAGLASFSTVRLTDSFVVPPDVSVKATQLGVASITFVRQFNDGGGPVALQATLVIGGSGAAQFNIFREALSFDDTAVVRVVQARDSLLAVAEINFSGSGTMSAVWEVAGPSTTAGQPVFRELQPVTRALLGSEPVIVRSPPLPTDSQGSYLVRLRITNPPPGFDPPSLTYYVGDSRSGAFGGVTPMVVTAPGDRAILEPDTRFAWQAVDGAKTYKIEVFASLDTDPFDLPDLSGPSEGNDLRRARAALSSPPTSGLVVTAPQTQVALTALSRAKLQARRTYFWRVQAIDLEGKVIGEGRVQQFRIP